VTQPTPDAAHEICHEFGIALHRMRCECGPSRHVHYPTTEVPQRIQGAERIPLRLVPVEVFTGVCGHEECANPDHLGYGISDAVSAWSDCNRATGQIYRVDDLNPANREDGDTVTIWVDPADVEWFSRRFGNA
jgi:hypothetical protein